MRPFDLARKYGVNEILIYTIMRYLQTTQGITFTKRGRRYALTNREVAIIEEELHRRGYKPVETHI